MRKIVLFIGLTLAQSLVASPDLNVPKGPCSIFFKRIIRKVFPAQSPYLNAEEYIALGATPIKKYFPDSEEQSPMNEDLFARLHLSPKALKAFERDLVILRENKARLQGFRRERDFENWWSQSRGRFLQKPAIDALKEKDLTLEAFLDLMHKRFIAQRLAEGDANPLRRTLRTLLRHPFIVAASVPIVGLSSKLVVFLWQLSMLGPGVQIVNSYTEPVVSPVAFKAQQRGAQDLSGIATRLQTMLSGHENIERFRLRLDELSHQIEGMSPETAKEKWDELELIYFHVFQEFKKTLPSNLRDGRMVYRDHHLVNPVFMAAALSAFDTQFWVHRRELERLDEAVAQGKTLTPEVVAQRRLHLQQMQACETRIAASLAGWKIYEFIYPEITNAGVDPNRLALQNAYHVFRREMNFDIYRSQFHQQIQQLLKELKFQYEWRNETKKALGE